MKYMLCKTAAAAALASVAAYFGILAAPVCILLLVMLVDYITGLTKAYLAADLSSRTGIHGILKKLSYMAMVVVGAVIDYLLETALQTAGVDLQLKMFFGLLVAVWLIINELISILENLTAIGVPGFPALTRLLSRLRQAVSTAVDESDNKKEA